MAKLNNNRYPPGLERKILRFLPKAVLGCIFVPLFMSIFVRVLPYDGTVDELARYITRIDIFGIALAISLFTMIFTLFIGCIIVVLMKGPGYVADAYELDDADEPDTASQSGKWRDSSRKKKD